MRSNTQDAYKLQCRIPFAISHCLGKHHTPNSFYKDWVIGWLLVYSFTSVWRIFGSYAHVIMTWHEKMKEQVPAKDFWPIFKCLTS